MYNGELNSLQLYHGKWQAGMVTTPKLREAWVSAPAKLPTLISYIFGLHDSEYKSPLQLLLGGLDNKMTVRDQVYEWSVQMQMERPTTIVKYDAGGSAFAGLNNAPIRIWVRDNFFGAGSILVFDDLAYQVHVYNEPMQDGDLWCYTCYVIGGPSSYIPTELLEPGSQVSNGGSMYPEFSDQADIVNWQTPFKMRNQLTISRVKWDITGSAYSSVIDISLVNPTSQRREHLIADEQEWAAWRKIIKQVDYMSIFGKMTNGPKNNSNLMAPNGFPVLSGAGILEQISPANKRYYTRLTADIIEDFLFDLSYNCIGTADRKFVGWTGEMGLREFDRVIKEKAGSLPIIDTTFITGSGQELTFGGQFKTVKFANSIEFTVQHLSLLDEPYTMRTYHPQTLKPLTSYWFLILDMGRRGGKANIRKVVREGREMVCNAIPGMVSPQGYGKSTSSFVANSRDGYTGQILMEHGVVVFDPRGCGMLLPSVEGVRL